MPGGNKKLDGKVDGLATRFGAPNGNKPGRQKRPDLLKTLKRQFREGITEISVPLSQVKIDNSSKVAKIKLETTDAVAVRLNDIIRNGKDGDFLKLIDNVSNRLYGRPAVSISVQKKPDQTIIFETATEENVAIENVLDGGDKD